MTSPENTSLPASSATSTPAPVSTTTESFTPTTSPVYTPEAAPLVPDEDLRALFEYTLSLINQDRQSAGLEAVTLNFNSAAQTHAQDMLDNQYLAHWGTDGQKPYMRYTLAGGLNYEGENSAYSSGNKKINAKTEIKALEYAMMNDDAASDWSHRDNILGKLHRKVNLGIAYNNTCLALVQQFEGDYVEYYQPPTITGNILSFSGRFTQKGLTLNNAAITYDELPQPLSGEQLNNSTYRRYGLGTVLGQVFAPPPAGMEYSSLPANSIIGFAGGVDKTNFSLQADISSILEKGPGAYTICLIVMLDGEATNLTNYSIFIE